MLGIFFMKKCYILHNALCFPWCNLVVVFYYQNQLPIAPTISATQFHIPKKRLVFSSASEMSHWLSGPSTGAPPGERGELSREIFCSIKIVTCFSFFFFHFHNDAVFISVFFYVVSITQYKNIQKMLVINSRGSNIIHIDHNVLNRITNNQKLQKQSALAVKVIRLIINLYTKLHFSKCNLCEKNERKLLVD